MEILNDTPFTVAPIPGRMPFPGHSLTLAVKGTFALAPGQRAVIAADQHFPTGDRYGPGESDKAACLYYGSDFAPFKPNTDLLLVGRLHGAKEKFTDKLPLTFGVGSWQTTRWVDEGMVRYGLSAGFGPLPVLSPHRLARIGRFGPEWKKKRWPWFPEDADWTHCNQAFPDQQIHPYLKGDESLCFTHIHPEYREFRSSLPGIRVRCFAHLKAPDPLLGSGFSEIPVKLDTLWADMDSLTLVLVWRGWVQTASADDEGLTSIYILSENVDNPSLPLNHCRDRWIQAREKENRKWEPAAGASPEPEKDQESEPELLPIPDPVLVEAVDQVSAPLIQPSVVDLRQRFKTRTAAFMAQLGLDTDRLNPGVRRAVESRHEVLLDRIMETDPAAVRSRTLADLERQKKQALTALGIDPTRAPTVTWKAEAEQVRMLKAMGMSEDRIQSMRLDPAFLECRGILAAILAGMGMDPENLEPLIQRVHQLISPLTAGPAPLPDPDRMPGKPDQAVEPVESGDPVAPDDRPGAPDHAQVRKQDRQRVQERATAKESFKGENFRGLDLSGLDLSGLDFSDADFTGACLARTVFSRSDLDDAVFEQAVLTGADFRGCRARDAWFVEAALTGADFSGADLMGADFSRSTLDKTRFSEAVLRQARFETVRCAAADFFRADLTEVRASGGSDFSKTRFSEVQGADSIWRGAVLRHTDFTFARLEGADFRKADLSGADLSAADMKFARFVQAGLSRAGLVRANLFQGSLEKADLDGTDLRGANLYGVEFLEARFRNTLVTGADLAMTKLSMDETP